MLHPLSQSLKISWSLKLPSHHLSLSNSHSLFLYLSQIEIYGFSFSSLLSLWRWVDQLSIIAKTQLTQRYGGWLDEKPTTPRVEEVNRTTPLWGFFFFFRLWVWSNFGLLMVVDLILVVLWLVACSGCGLWGDQWWWWLLMVVALVVDECERERGTTERGWDLWCCVTI